MSNTSECVSVIEPIILKKTWKINNVEDKLNNCKPGDNMIDTNFGDPRMPDTIIRMGVFPAGQIGANPYTSPVHFFVDFASTSRTRIVRHNVEYFLAFIDDDEVERTFEKQFGEFRMAPGRSVQAIFNLRKHVVLRALRQKDKSIILNCHLKILPVVDDVQMHRIIKNPTPKIENRNIHTHKWGIRFYKDLAKFCKRGECLKSQVFAKNWSLHLYPGSKSEQDGKRTSLVLHNNSKSTISARFSISFLVDKNEEQILFNSTEDIPVGGKQWNLEANYMRDVTRKDRHVIIICKLEELPMREPEPISHTSCEATENSETDFLSVVLQQFALY